MAVNVIIVVTVLCKEHCAPLSSRCRSAGADKLDDIVGGGGLSMCMCHACWWRGERERGGGRIDETEKRGKGREEIEGGCR